MTRWRALADELGNDPVLSALEESEVEALVDVLALTIHADETVAPIEVAGFNHLVFDMPWMEGHRDHVEGYIKEAAAKAAEAATDDGARRRIAEGAAARLEGAELRERVFRMAASLAGVDLDLVADEEKALDWLAAAFELDADHVKSVIDAARPQE